MIGKEPKINLETQKESLEKELKTLEESKSQLQKKLQALSERIERREKRKDEWKIYYPPLDAFYTAKEVLELEAFFSQEPSNIISTELTSIC